MGSMYWTADEARYLQAIFSWQDRQADELNGRGGRLRDASAHMHGGDFRVLLIGAKGVGKTALLTRVFPHFVPASSRSSSLPVPFSPNRQYFNRSFRDTPDARFERGGRWPVRVDGLRYSMDVLEMPLVDEAAGLAGTGSAPAAAAATATATAVAASMMLEQALAITEAAIIVYDVCRPASFQQARRLYERLQKQQHPDDPVDETPRSRRCGSRRGSVLRKKMSMRFRFRKPDLPAAAASPPPPPTACDQRPQSSVPADTAARRPARPYALLLVGNKSDAADADRGVSPDEGREAVDLPFPLFSPAAPSTAGAGPFLEASAQSGAHVDDVFVQMGRAILRQRGRAGAAAGAREQTSEAPAADSSSASATSSSTTTATAAKPVPLLHTKSQRTFGVLRALGRPFGRRATVSAVRETPAAA